jgi:hypothetical protein
MKLQIKVENLCRGAYTGYFSSKFRKGVLATHANRFDENRVYNITSYSKGNLLDPIDVFDKGRDDM